jgi:N-succinyldiaminopimelate aminotransferase
MRATNSVKQFLSYTHSGPMQAAVAYALGSEMGWVADLRASLQSRRDRLAAGLTSIGLDVHVPQGTYFIQADVRAIGLADGEPYAWALPRQAGVAAIPTAVFCDTPGVGTPFVRFAFCKRDEVLDEAVSRLTASTRPG